MENQRKFTYLNKETREIIKNLCENGISILAIAQICGVHRTTVWRVIKRKQSTEQSEVDANEDFKAVR